MRAERGASDGPVDIAGVEADHRESGEASLSADEKTRTIPPARNRRMESEEKTVRLEPFPNEIKARVALFK